MIKAGVYWIGNDLEQMLLYSQEAKEMIVGNSK